MSVEIFYVLPMHSLSEVSFTKIKKIHDCVKTFEVFGFIPWKVIPRTSNVSLAVKKNFITYFSDEENYPLKLIQFFYKAMSQHDLVSKILTS